MDDNTTFTPISESEKEIEDSRGWRFDSSETTRWDLKHEKRWKIKQAVAMAISIGVAFRSIESEIGPSISISETESYLEIEKPLSTRLRDEVKEVLVQQILEGDENNKIIYIANKLLSPGEKIESVRKNYIVPNFGADYVVVAFVDLHPGANLGHEIMYVFLDAENPNCNEREIGMYPPSESQMKVFGKL